MDGITFKASTAQGKEEAYVSSFVSQDTPGTVYLNVDESGKRSVRLTPEQARGLADALTEGAFEVDLDKDIAGYFNPGASINNFVDIPTGVEGAVMSAETLKKYVADMKAIGAPSIKVFSTADIEDPGEDVCCAVDCNLCTAACSTCDNDCICVAFEPVGDKTSPEYNDPTDPFGNGEDVCDFGCCSKESGFETMPEQERSDFFDDLNIAERTLVLIQLIRQEKDGAHYKEERKLHTILNTALDSMVDAQNPGRSK